MRPYLRGAATWYENGELALTAAFLSAPAGVSPFTITTKMDDVMGTVGAGIDLVSADAAVASRLRWPVRRQHPDQRRRPHGDRLVLRRLQRESGSCAPLQVRQEPTLDSVAQTFRKWPFSPVDLTRRSRLLLGGQAEQSRTWVGRRVTPSGPTEPDWAALQRCSERLVASSEIGSVLSLLASSAAGEHQ